MSNKQQLLAIKSIDVWENVWERFGICQHDKPIPSKLLAKCMGKQNAMAAEVLILMGDVL